MSRADKVFMGTMAVVIIGVIIINALTINMFEKKIKTLESKIEVLEERFNKEIEN